MRRLRRLLATLTICSVLMAIPAACPPACLADTVFLRDGTTRAGTVTARGDKIIVQTAGETLELDAKDVISILRDASAATAPAATGAPAVTPVSPAATPGSLPAATASTDTSLPALGPGPATIAPQPTVMMPLDRLDMPESRAYVTMRSIAVATAGFASANLRQQLENWRAFAHDNKRQVGTSWLGPDDFVQHRKAYDEHLREAAKLVREVQKLQTEIKSLTARKDKDSDSELAKKETQLKKATVAVQTKLQDAAKVWPDPLIRRFLLAIEYLNQKQYTTADGLFRLCMKDAPHIAAFHQGLAMSLLEQNRPLEAMPEALAAMALAPYSDDALLLLQQAAKAYPGSEMRNDAYVRSQAILSQYMESKPPSSSAKGVNWLMPGKPWAAKEDTLPSPPYDRLILRQAMAVPVANSTLLIDANAVRGAIELQVQVNPTTVSPAFTASQSSSYSTRQTPVFAMISVPFYAFTAPPLADDPKAAVGGMVRFHAVAIYSELGNAPRELRTRLDSVEADGAIKLGSPPSPGEGMAPLFSDRGELLGMLAGKIDVNAEDAGPNVLIGAAQIAPLIKRIPTFAAPRTSNQAKFKTPPTPQAARGEAFVVHIITPEKFE